MAGRGTQKAQGLLAGRGTQKAQGLLASPQLSSLRAGETRVAAQTKTTRSTAIRRMKIKNRITAQHEPLLAIALFSLDCRAVCDGSQGREGDNGRSVMNRLAQQRMGTGRIA